MAREADRRIEELTQRLEDLSTRAGTISRPFGVELSGDGWAVATAIDRAAAEISLGLARVELRLETLLDAPALAGD